MVRIGVLTIVLSLIFSHSAQSQTRFHAQVEVEYEKTLNAKSAYKAAMGDWFDQVKDHIPNQIITYHRFIGDTSQSVYGPGRETSKQSGYWSEPIADKNLVYANYKNQQMMAQKPVFEEVFLVADSLPRISWKLTADTRTIAGYECRKAVGILDDTVAVFAFYTDEILIPGGPESIHGLPGLILGMGVPRANTTWFATRVLVNGVNLKDVVPPKKGKKTTRQEMTRLLGEVMRQWGTCGSRMIVH